MLTNYVYKLRPNQTQDLKMSNGVICCEVTSTGVLMTESLNIINNLFKVTLATLEQKVKPVH